MSEAAVQMETSAILTAEDVTKRFVKRLDLAGKIAQRLGSSIREETVHAVDGVSLSIAPGEVLGLVGESGCGKSTFGRMVAGILPPTEGSLSFDGRPIWQNGEVTSRETALAVQMIFQDPFASLNPRMSAGRLVMEPMVIHGIAAGSELEDRAAELFRRVGLEADHMRRFPHEFSGGQRQRICIARALGPGPRLIVADEPTSALDVSVQAQVLELLLELQQTLGLAYLFISHDMAVVELMSHRVAVMHKGRIVEMGPRPAVLNQPRHPYTAALLAAVPVPDPTRPRGVLPKLDVDHLPRGTLEEVAPGHLVAA